VQGWKTGHREPASRKGCPTQPAIAENAGAKKAPVSQQGALCACDSSGFHAGPLILQRQEKYSTAPSLKEDLHAVYSRNTGTLFMLYEKAQILLFLTHRLIIILCVPFLRNVNKLNG